MIAWHPLGSCMATAANDGIVKFWSREPPGSKLSTYVGEYMEDLHIDHGPLPGAVAEVSNAQAAVKGGAESSIIDQQNNSRNQSSRYNNNNNNNNNNNRNDANNQQDNRNRYNNNNNNNASNNTSNNNSYSTGNNNNSNNNTGNNSRASDVPSYMRKDNSASDGFRDDKSRNVPPSASANSNNRNQGRGNVTEQPSHYAPPPSAAGGMTHGRDMADDISMKYGPGTSQNYYGANVPDAYSTQPLESTRQKRSRFS
jgi:hypothetical protein